MMGDPGIGQHIGHAYPCTNDEGLFITDTDERLSTSLPFPFSHLFQIISDPSPPQTHRCECAHRGLIKFTSNRSSNVDRHIDRVSVAAYLISHRSDPRRWTHRPSISEVRQIEQRRRKHRADNVTKYRPHAHI